MSLHFEKSTAVIEVTEQVVAKQAKLFDVQDNKYELGKKINLNLILYGNKEKIKYMYKISLTI